MKRALQLMTYALAVLAAAAVVRPSHAEASLPAPEIRIADVDLFYRVYDAAKGKPSAEVLQRDYLDAGSEGLRQFVTLRIGSAQALAKKIAEKPGIYEKARTCAAQLPDVRARVAAALAKLGELLPNATFPPVTLLIGRGNTGGTTSKAGVLIGVETICSADWMQPDVGDRLVHLIAHEYAHVQQPIVERMEDPKAGTVTVLEASLVEGIADFVAELISGSVSNIHLQSWVAGREPQIEAAFLKEMNDTKLDHWLYNGVGTPEKPGDLGYWVGYRIAKQYYERAADKKKAVQELVELDSPQRILEDSGWAERVRAASPAQESGAR